ncbi:protein of unknown function [Agreia sp. COWG]|nr:protein of unknown function [Agreia sp. COWG]
MCDGHLYPFEYNGGLSDWLTVARRRGLDERALTTEPTQLAEWGGGRPVARAAPTGAGLSPGPSVRCD